MTFKIYIFNKQTTQYYVSYGAMGNYSNKKTDSSQEKGEGRKAGKGSVLFYRTNSSSQGDTQLGLSPESLSRCLWPDSFSREPV